MSKVIFKRKNTNEIKNLSVEDGSLIYNYETGETYMDYGNDRVPINKLPKTEKYENHTDDDTTSYSCDYINNLKPIVNKKDANGWIKIEFVDHVEYVYYNVTNRTFPKDWGYADSVPLPVGMESLGERVLTNSVMSADAAVVISAGAYQNSKNIFVEYNNAYSGTTGSTEYILSFRILEYK